MRGGNDYAIDNMPDKTNKLTANNPVVKDRIGMLVPVESSFGRIITIFSPNCCLARCVSFATLPPKPRRRSLRTWVTPTSFPPNQSLGEHSVQNLIKLRLEKLGFRVLLATLSGVSSLPGLLMTLI